MATAYTYNTAKRHNSTLIPTGGSSITVNLKGGSDLLTPTFLLNQAAVPSWSMMSFEGRYYFVTGIRNIRNDLWEVDGKVDVLATYKSNIQAISAFVLYDMAGNSKLVDGRLPIETDVTVTSDTVSYFSPYYNALGCYLLTAANRSGCFTYVLSESDLTTLLTSLAAWINGQITGATVEDVIREVGTLLVGSGDVMNNIKGLSWVPFSASDISSTVRACDIGLYQGSFNAAYVTGYQNISWTQRISIPWQFSDWRRNQPYTQIYLYIPYIGVIMIPAGNITGDSELDCQFSVNKRTGAMAVNVYGATSGEHVYTGSGMCGIAIPIGATGFNAGSFVNGSIAAASSIIAGDLFGTAKNAVNALQSNPQSAGAIAGGAGSGLSQNLIIDVVCHDVSATPSGMALGIPTFRTKSLSGLSGYVQTQGASVSGTMTDTERNEINMLLDGGVFIE